MFRRYIHNTYAVLSLRFSEDSITKVRERKGLVRQRNLDHCHSFVRLSSQLFSPSTLSLTPPPPPLSPSSPLSPQSATSPQTPNGPPDSGPNWSFEQYTKTNFKTHKRGLLVRNPIPVDEMSRWVKVSSTDGSTTCHFGTMLPCISKLRFLETHLQAITSLLWQDNCLWCNGMLQEDSSHYGWSTEKLPWPGLHLWRRPRYSIHPPMRHHQGTRYAGWDLCTTMQTTQPQSKFVSTLFNDVHTESSDLTLYAYSG